MWRTHWGCSPLLRAFSSAAAPRVALRCSPWSDEALVACAQSYFAAYPLAPAASAPLPTAPSLPRVMPLPGSAIPQLHELSLWELVRLLKVEEDMAGVAGFPRLRAELLLRHAVRLMAAVPWERASAEDAAALHALAVHFADRAVSGGSEGAAAAAAGGEEAAGGAPSGAADEFKRLQNACKQHFSPAIAALLEARAWPPAAVADIAHTLGPRRLLSGAAAGALVRYVAAVAAPAAAGAAAATDAAAAGAPALGLEEAVDLLLGLAACPEVELEEEGGACGQGEVDAVFRACAERLRSQLLAQEDPATATATAAAAPVTPVTPLATLAALAQALCERFDSEGKDAALAAGSGPGGEGGAPPSLTALAQAIGTCAAARLRAHVSEQPQAPLPLVALVAASASAGAPAPASSASAAARAYTGESAVAAHALAIAKCLGCMGVWHAPLVGLVGGEWGRRWGRAGFAALLSPRAAADALFLASLSAAHARAPPFPPAPGRLCAGWNESGKILFLLNGLGKGLHARPLLPRPFPPRPAEAAFARAFAAAWEECRSAAEAGGGGGAAALDVLRHASGGTFVTPEGCVLDVAVPGASCGGRVVRSSSDYRPGRSGLSATLLAEQGVLEATGWTVEYVLEADLSRAGKAAQAARRLLAAELDRRSRQGRA